MAAKKKKADYSGNANKIYSVLRREGFSDVAARGALARMRQESGFNPNALNKNDAGPGNHSRGIFQWNRDRLANLQRFGGKNWTDVETQARFFAHESKTTEKRYGDKLRAAKTPEQAASAAISMARPAGWTAKNPSGGHGWKNTLNWTKNMNVKASGPSTLYARDESKAPADGGVLDNTMLALSASHEFPGTPGGGMLDSIRAQAGQKVSVPQGVAAGITSDGKLADAGGGALSVIDYFTMPMTGKLPTVGGATEDDRLEMSGNAVDPADLNLLPRNTSSGNDGPSDAAGFGMGILSGVSQALKAFNANKKEASWVKSPGQRRGTTISRGLLSPKMVG